MYHFFPGSAVASRKTFCTLLQHSCSYASLQFTTMVGWSRAGSVSLLTKKKLSSSWHRRRTHDRVTSRRRVEIKRGDVSMPKPKSQMERPCAECDATRLVVSFHQGFVPSASSRRHDTDDDGGAISTRWTRLPDTSNTARVCGGSGGSVASAGAAVVRLVAESSPEGWCARRRRKRNAKNVQTRVTRNLGPRPARHIRHAEA